MSKLNKGKALMANVKLHLDYLKYRDGRYEKWEEAVEDMLACHKEKFPALRTEIDRGAEMIKSKLFLASQRSLQWRGEGVKKHNARLYNCCATYLYSPDFFGKAMYVLLAGCGLGVSIGAKYISQLPCIQKRGDTEMVYKIPDSIEGWSNAIKVLISSYCQHTSLYKKYFGRKVIFDTSAVRPAGSLISGGFKAPGPQGLEESLRDISNMFETALMDSASIEFSSVLAYDTLMFISRSVLSGGVRRSATTVLIGKDDQAMIEAKTGNWWEDNPQRVFSNNSVLINPASITEAEFLALMDANEGRSDLGVVFSKEVDTVFNPCYEIHFNFYGQIRDREFTAFQFCNLTEINMSKVTTYYDFIRVCKYASLIGTLQASYTSFPYLGDETERIVKEESLIGVSLTGVMDCPIVIEEAHKVTGDLEELLKGGAKVVKETNKDIAKRIGINPAGRCTTIKPSGNASVILGTTSGVHSEPSSQYYRVMQINRSTEIAKFFETHYPKMLEPSITSPTDVVIYFPIEASSYVHLTGLEQLDWVDALQRHWVREGQNKDYCFKDIHNNVSATVSFDASDKERILQRVFALRDTLPAVSFGERNLGLEYAQAPLTPYKSASEIMDTWGGCALIMYHIVKHGVDHYNQHFFNLLNKCISLRNEPDTKDYGEYASFIEYLEHHAQRYFNNDFGKLVELLKYLYLYKKLYLIEDGGIPTEVELNAPDYIPIANTAAIACQGGKCDF